ncbi:outer membrane beta-barrel protein [Hymenobacter coccineus]|uniref:Outer membrane protein beta-barrel domain-containing protein n=1 Tax=Hymenobacter coccineus TaxID=1908235 RepID=A0A1G1TKV1_9BACT|nr:outer membrane beta-barrel protein [Hymenobacter coccineus]OGX91491.1 hypothetical protein BEN49_04780 [Hymenobacter coccineus]
MKTIHKLAVIGALCWGSVPGVAHAQTSFSLVPQIGLSLTTARYEDASQPSGAIDIAYRRGLTAGVLASLQHQRVSLQVGAQFAARGFTLNETYATPSSAGPLATNYHQQYRFNYLDFPLTVAFSQHPDGQGAQVFGGGYVAVLLGGQVKYDNSFETLNGPVNFQSESQVRAGDSPSILQGDFYTKRVDAGVKAGVGYRWHSLLLRGSYQIGLVNLGTVQQNNPLPAPKYYNRSFDISLGYYLF